MNDRDETRGAAGRIAAGSRRGLVLAAALALGLAGCDTDVLNPGPVQDSFLDDDDAFPALVNGMGRAVAEALNWIGYTGAAVAREIHPSGSTGSFGITVKWQRGELDPTDDALDTHWEQAQQARWLAESGIARMEENGAPADQLAQAYLWAGYANRLLGENMCQAVIDGGSPEPSTVYLERAEDWFRQAAQSGSGSVATAGQAGLASVLLDLGQYQAAAQEAAGVPDGFSYVVPYFELGDDDQRNRIAWSTAAEPYKAHTQWNTWVAEVGLSDDNPDGDPRVAFTVTNEVGDAAIDCCGNVPWWPEAKYGVPEADIELSSTEEMRLIQAEAALRDGDVDGAMALINENRTAVGLDPRTAAGAEEAWTILKRERAIELWLEGRRLGDLARWDADGTPGALHSLETPSGSTDVGSHLAVQDLCFPIPPSEQDTNPNVPSAGG